MIKGSNTDIDDQLITRRWRIIIFWNTELKNDNIWWQWRGKGKGLTCHPDSCHSQVYQPCNTSPRHLLPYISFMYSQHMSTDCLNADIMMLLMFALNILDIWVYNTKLEEWNAKCCWRNIFHQAATDSIQYKNLWQFIFNMPHLKIQS